MSHSKVVDGLRKVLRLGIGEGLVDRSTLLVAAIVGGELFDSRSSSDDGLVEVLDDIGGGRGRELKLKSSGEGLLRGKKIVLNGFGDLGGLVFDFLSSSIELGRDGFSCRVVFSFVDEETG